MGIQLSAYNSQTKSYIETNEDGWSPNFSYSNGNLFLGWFGIISTIDEGLCGEASVLAFRLAINRVKLELVNSEFIDPHYQYYKICFTLDNKKIVEHISCDYINTKLRNIEKYIDDSEKLGADLIRWS